MVIQVEFLGPIQRGNRAQKEAVTTEDGGTLGQFLTEIGYPAEQHKHILVARNGRVTRDFDTVLQDGDGLQLSVLLGGG